MNMALKKQFAQAYSNTFVETAVSEASPHKLIQMLYDGALKNMNLAKVFLEQKNFEKKSAHINKALSILGSLRDGVDVDKGGNVGSNLLEIYDYCYRTLFAASAQNDIAKVDEVIDLIKSISDAWQQMPDNIKRASKEQLDRIGG
ncbi:flagellar export chaperone FliS [Thiomicrorhabdus sediminis]|uniref:Flagellar secretion chaperone FliS n=1 Tax=Thiomicrorhabdus sediminis TaxID=2580412 RepID=A0A4P9K640_9GAMM|nr:flagellar export chaperone FliS [Thiomicrorhabdus sediminis]QCU90459.1 flagellar export chaperone FliS [Thiomicrorhabdus sediminis]